MRQWLCCARPPDAFDFGEEAPSEESRAAGGAAAPNVAAAADRAQRDAHGGPGAPPVLLSESLVTADTPDGRDGAHEAPSSAVREQLARSTRSTLLLLAANARTSAAQRATKTPAHFALQARTLAERKLARLRSLQLFVLDNTVRESTVAQLRGHTLADKHELIALVRDAGIRDQLVACFAAQRRVDDQLARQLHSDAACAAAYAGQTFYAFAELHERNPAAPHAVSAAPTVGMLRALEYGMRNLVMEMDCRCPILDTVQRATTLLGARLAWVREHLGADARVFVNLRDYVPANEAPSTLEGVTRFLAALPAEERVAGLLFEDSSGGVFPATLGAYVAATRALMNDAGWAEGHLLVHVHHGYGLAEACVLESLACGATGIWCGISRDGAGVGHANSLTTICNLARLGNEDARARFNLAKLRAAAIEATRICTGELPHPQTELYGARALDVCFDPSFGMGAYGEEGGFDAASTLAVQPRIRVSTMTTVPMFGDKLSEVFGAEAAPDGAGGWPLPALRQMWANVNRDLLAGVKEEYDSPDALLALYERSGGGVSKAMRASVAALTRAEAHPVVAAFRAAFAAAFGEDAVECDATAFYDCMCGRFFASPDSAQFATLCQLCAFSDGDAPAAAAEGNGADHTKAARPAVIQLAAAASRFAWAVRCYPAECVTLDTAWVCVIQRLVTRRLALQKVRRRFRVGLQNGVSLLSAMRRSASKAAAAPAEA